jgi:hypothetical protein
MDMLSDYDVNLFLSEATPSGRCRMSAIVRLLKPLITFKQFELDGLYNWITNLIIV